MPGAADTGFKRAELGIKGGIGLKRTKFSLKRWATKIVRLDGTLQVIQFALVFREAIKSSYRLAVAQLAFDRKRSFQYVIPRHP